MFGLTLFELLIVLLSAMAMAGAAIIGDWCDQLKRDGTEIVK